MPLTRTLDYTLPLCMIGTILFLVFDLDAGAWLARLALLLYLLVQWPRQARMAKGILLVVIAMAALLSGVKPSLFRFCCRPWIASVFATFVSSWACCASLPCARGWFAMPDRP